MWTGSVYLMSGVTSCDNVMYSCATHSMVNMEDLSLARMPCKSHEAEICQFWRSMAGALYRRVKITLLYASSNDNAGVTRAYCTNLSLWPHLDTTVTQCHSTLCNYSTWHQTTLFQINEKLLWQNPGDASNDMTLLGHDERCLNHYFRSSSWLIGNNHGDEMSFLKDKIPETEHGFPILDRNVKYRRMQ